MARTEQNDEFYANNPRALLFTVLDEDGGPLNLTGLTAKWALTKASAGGGYSTTPIFEKTSAAGITVISAVAGTLRVDILPADTITLKGLYYHELELFDASAQGIVAATGNLTILRNVVNA